MGRKNGNSPPRNIEVATMFRNLKPFTIGSLVLTCCLMGCGAGKMTTIADDFVSEDESAARVTTNLGSARSDRQVRNQTDAMPGHQAALNESKSQKFDKSAQEPEECTSTDFVCGPFSNNLIELCGIYGGGTECQASVWNKAFYKSLMDRLAIWQNGKVIDSEVSFWVEPINDRQEARRLNISEPVRWKFDQNKFKMTNSGRVNENGEVVDLWLADTISDVMVALKRDWGIIGIDYSSVYRKGALVHHTRRKSRHSYGLAMDIRGFYLEDGRLITVAGNWRAKDGTQVILRNLNAFLKNYFNLVLGPSDDRDHRDHFHVDLDRSNRPLSYKNSLEWPFARGKMPTPKPSKPLNNNLSSNSAIGTGQNRIVAG